MMNISLKLPPKKKKKKNNGGITLAAEADSAVVPPGAPKNVFGEGSEDENDGDNDTNDASLTFQRRNNVNQAIQKEQEAMRKRAEQAMKKKMEEHQQQGGEETATPSIYDYDSFKNHGDDKADMASQTAKSNGGGKEEPKKSRYIADLLKAAKERNYERDIAYERKMAREQAQEEDENVDLQGKQKFVTAGYKRKLEERRLWKEKRDQQDEQNEQQEVTMAQFYGNFSKNVAMGGGDAREDEEAPGKDQAQTSSTFLQGFEKEESDDLKGSATKTIQEKTKLPAAAASANEAKQTLDPEVARAERRKVREEKVARARERYFQRTRGHETMGP